MYVTLYDRYVCTCFCHYVSTGVLLLQAVHVPLASAEAVPAANPAAATSHDAATPPTAHLQLGDEGTVGTPSYQSYQLRELKC